MMKTQYAFNDEQMNGIVEDTYTNIIKECENLKKITNCSNEASCSTIKCNCIKLAPS